MIYICQSFAVSKKSNVAFQIPGSRKALVATEPALGVVPPRSHHLKDASHRGSEAGATCTSGSKPTHLVISSAAETDPLSLPSFAKEIHLIDCCAEAGFKHRELMLEKSN